MAINSIDTNTSKIFQPNAELSSPDSASVDAFNKALEGTGTQNVSPEFAQRDAGGAKTIGDAILQGIASIRQSNQQQMDEIAKGAAFSDENPTNMMSSILRTQMATNMLSLQLQLESKIAGQFNQGIQTLFRIQ
jgi:hypothetical protein